MTAYIEEASMAEDLFAQLTDLESDYNYVHDDGR